MKTSLHHLDRFRLPLPPTPPGATFGAFQIPRGRHATLCIIASDGTESGWDHVSIHARDRGGMRCPTWEEMAYVKDLFFDAEECVAQFHPPRSHYVNNHPFVLHMWKRVGSEFELPPSILVGIR